MINVLRLGDKLKIILVFYFYEIGWLDILLNEFCKMNFSLNIKFDLNLV